MRLNGTVVCVERSNECMNDDTIRLADVPSRTMKHVSSGSPGREYPRADTMYGLLLTKVRSQMWGAGFRVLVLQIALVEFDSFQVLEILAGRVHVYDDGLAGHITCSLDGSAITYDADGALLRGGASVVRLVCVVQREIVVDYLREVEVLAGEAAEL